jgi:hypothetical protein
MNQKFIPTPISSSDSSAFPAPYNDTYRPHNPGLRLICIPKIGSRSVPSVLKYWPIPILMKCPAFWPLFPWSSTLVGWKTYIFTASTHSFLLDTGWKTDSFHNHRCSFLGISASQTLKTHSTAASTPPAGPSGDIKRGSPGDSIPKNI